MEIIKYFFEEPFSLETLTPDLDPDARHREAPAMPLEALLNSPEAYRGYLAGTDLEAGRVGLTALPRPDVFTEPLLDWLKAYRWARTDAEGRTHRLDPAAARAVLGDPRTTAVLACATEEIPAGLMADVGGGVQRQALSALRRLLSNVEVAFFPEPAHHGFDWSFFSRRPMRESLVAAFRQHPVPDPAGRGQAVRRFVLPYQKARSEHKFYFEQWQLGEPSLPAYIEEV